MGPEAEVERLITEPTQDPYRDFDLHLDLKRALEKLSGYDLLLLCCVFDAQISYEDLAALLGITRQAVTAKIGRILAGLREQLSS